MHAGLRRTLVRLPTDTHAYQVFGADEFFADHTTAHGDPGSMHGLGITAHQRMPLGKIFAARQEAIRASRRQPRRRARELGCDLHAVRHAPMACLVVLTACRRWIEKLARGAGRHQAAAFGIVNLHQAAARAAITQRFPLARAHLFESLGFPEHWGGRAHAGCAACRTRCRVTRRVRRIEAVGRPCSRSHAWQVARMTRVEEHGCMHGRHCVRRNDRVRPRLRVQRRYDEANAPRLVRKLRAENGFALRLRHVQSRGHRCGRYSEIGLRAVGAHPRSADSTCPG